MQLSELPEAFVEQFANTRWLNLSNNLFSTLPAALEAIPRITRLTFSYNSLVMDAAANAVLAKLVRLRILNLDHNPLITAPDVSTLADLRGLRLQHTGISTWPTGLMDLAMLEEVDLRANNIQVVPQDVLAPSAERVDRVLRINRVTSLHGNPIDADSQTLDSVRNCGDAVILVFSQLEVQVLINHALALGTQLGAEWSLMKLARGLYRLEQVELIARRVIDARVRAGTVVDEVEVRLAYRTALTEP
uniref:NEL domain-containing protein n=1 Tax=Steinernema glaseri TaxID=37863 RepID=A0A1I7Y382_9BILA